jgi:ASC-1-like (ASCH) protein
MNILYLNSPWFELVKQGKKIYEGRRNTLKVREICIIGNIITIKHFTDATQEPYQVIIEDFKHFSTFEDALRELDINEILPLENITVEKGVLIYQKYVSLKTQNEDGTVMIKIKVI